VRFCLAAWDLSRAPSLQTELVQRALAVRADITQLCPAIASPDLLILLGTGAGQEPAVRAGDKACGNPMRSDPQMRCVPLCATLGINHYRLTGDRAVDREWRVR
jgi:hypothetical protein